jgi:hypothetical protein
MEKIRYQYEFWNQQRIWITESCFSVRWIVYADLFYKYMRGISDGSTKIADKDAALKMFTSRAQNLIFSRSWNCDILALGILKAAKFLELNRILCLSQSDAIPIKCACQDSAHGYVRICGSLTWRLQKYCPFRPLSKIFWTGLSHLNLRQNLCSLCMCSGMKKF